MIAEPVYLWGFILIALLIPLVVADLKYGILPNYLNILLCLSGILQSFFVENLQIMECLLGGGLAGATLFFVAKTYKKIRNVEGLGMGDVKLAAAGGLWVGWSMVGVMIFVGAFSAAIFVLVRTWRIGKLDRLERIPFGPFLAVGILCSWIFRQFSFL